MKDQGITALIAGGSGMIGQRLASQFESKGFGVRFLSRNPHPDDNRYYQWDPSNGYVDTAAFDGVEILVILSGENLADKLWTPWRRRNIVNSRVFPIKLLRETLSKIPNRVKVVVSAAAIGIYGNTSDRILHEDAPHGKGFVAGTCERWEGAAHRFGEMGIRTIILRIGLVLSRSGGIFPRLLQPLRFGIAPVFSNGKQYMSWIHVDDLCRMIVKSAREEHFSGIYNAVAPGPLCNRNFIKLLAQVYGHGYFLIHIPAVLLRLALGEMSTLLTHGQRVSPEKMEQAGFKFNFPQAHLALKNLLGKS